MFSRNNHRVALQDSPEDLELESDSGTESNSKIEKTKAEEEAIDRGLQVWFENMQKLTYIIAMIVVLISYTLTR